MSEKQISTVTNNSNEAEALFQQALKYVGDDYLEQAVECYEQAASLGHAGAAFELAIMFLKGIGCDKNEAKAFQLYLQAANAGIPDAMHNLAVCYEYGTGTVYDGHKALEWLQKAYEADPVNFGFIAERLQTDRETILTPPGVPIQPKDIEEYPSLKNVKIYKGSPDKGYPFAVSKQRASIYTEVEAERERQDKQWGGADGDDNNSSIDWLRYINKQLNYAHGANGGEYRERMLKIAALAIAGVESIDRKSTQRPD